MAFRHVTSANNRFGKEVAKDTTQAIVKGQVLGWGAATGEVEPLTNTSGYADALFVSTEEITTGEAKAKVHVLKISENDQFIADAVNNSNIAHNGQEMILDTTGTTVNNTGTTSAVGVVRQVGVVGAPADKQILVEFVTKQ